MPQDSVEFYIWSSDQSYIYYMYASDEEIDYNIPGGDSYYFIRGKPLPDGTNSSLLPGEIAIRSGTNNVWWRDTDEGTLYQAKGINLSQEEPEKTNNEIYKDHEEVGYSKLHLNLIRSQQKFLLSANRLRNTTSPGSYDKQTNILYIIDSSGSMDTRLQGRSSRLEVAVSILKDLFSGVPGRVENIRLGLGFLGGKRGGRGLAACGNYPILAPIDSDNTEELIAGLNSLRAAGGTPIAGALNNAVDVFNDLETDEDAENYIVLLSDGKEECEGDVKAAAKNVFDSGINLRVIGLGMDREYRDDFGFDEGYVEFFENPSEAFDLDTALQRSLAITKKEMKVFLDEKEKEILTEEPIIDARKTSTTKRQYVDAYVRLEGVPNDFYRIKIPDLRSGYTYNVSYDYLPSLAGTYFCRKSSQKRIGPFNSVFEVPEEKTCANSTGVDGEICKVVNKNFFWKQKEGTRTKSGNASCNKEADLGRSSRFFGVRSSSGCGNKRYRNRYFRCRSLSDVGKTTCLIDHEFEECKVVGKTRLYANTLLNREAGFGWLFKPSKGGFGRHRNGIEVPIFEYIDYVQGNITLLELLGTRGDWRRFRNGRSCSYKKHRNKIYEAPLYIKRCGRDTTTTKTKETEYCGCAKKEVEVEYFGRNDSYEYETCDEYGTETVRNGCCCKDKTTTYYLGDPDYPVDNDACYEKVGEISKLKEVCKITKSVSYDCTKRKCVKWKTETRTFFTYHTVKETVDCNDTSKDKKEGWELPITIGDETYTGILKGPDITIHYYKMNGPKRTRYFAYHCTEPNFYWDRVSSYRDRKLNEKYGDYPPFNLGFRGCVDMTTVGDYRVSKTNETLRRCVDEGIYECVGTFDVRYCEGEGQTPSEWNNLTVTDDDGDEIQYVTYETTN